MKNKSTYVLKPEIDLNTDKKVLLSKEIIETIKNKTLSKGLVIIETYPGIRLEVLKKEIIDKLNPAKLIWSEDFALQGKDFRDAILPELTEDRVFGKFTKHEYKDYFNLEKVKETQESFNNDELTIVYGVGASYFGKGDFLVYVDIPRWELQLRYRNKERVFFGGTLESETIKNFKRGYFIEWRMADKIKRKLAPTIDLFIDGSLDEFKAIDNKTFFESIKASATRPFRLVPYFDAGIWGGKWMQDKFGLGENKHSKWAWGFDGVPEENSVRFKFANAYFEMPAINVVFFEPKNLLGQKVHDRFGEEFPIRFDFLDTIKGGNLSLQVHPTNEYIKEQFGALYTQEESYYILDVDDSAEADPACYLGLNSKTNKEEFLSELKKAQKTNHFDADKFSNKFPAKKHDHFSHPAGVVHSSASGCMVLEISATPYIFTFKLWDWGRVDFDGKPRPINIEHGSKVIDDSFDTQRCLKELVSPFKTLEDKDKVLKEKTGLHERQFIDTIRTTIKTNEGVVLQNNDSVNMLNLVEGERVIIESCDDSFPSLIINYAETFIVPESCKEYKIRPIGPSLDKEVMILQAYVRY